VDEHHPEAELRRLDQAWREATERAASLIKNRTVGGAPGESARIKAAQGEVDAIARRYEALRSATARRPEAPCKDVAA
jgi:hypothetical protein